jgi:hypothetical protein
MLENPTKMLFGAKSPEEILLGFIIKLKIQDKRVEIFQSFFYFITILICNNVTNFKSKQS